jgi:aspartyl-tRNA(Asn)/glutamyl-tRNA(Gln) amidotransferase subunit A
MEKDAAAAAELPLMGIPVAVKDNFASKGIRTTASSTLLDTFIPQYDSTVTKRLKAAGGVISSKTNLDAWAHGSSTETSQYGRTLNPRNTEHLPQVAAQPLLLLIFVSQQSVQKLLVQFASLQLGVEQLA